MCMNRHFFKDIGMANKQMERCSTLFREMNIKNHSKTELHIHQIDCYPKNKQTPHTKNNNYCLASM